MRKFIIYSNDTARRQNVCLFKFLFCLTCFSIFIVICVRNPPEHFVESLHDALTGLTTSNTTAARIIITRAEVFNQIDHLQVAVT